MYNNEKPGITIVVSNGDQLMELSDIMNGILVIKITIEKSNEIIYYLRRKTGDKLSIETLL